MWPRYHVVQTIIHIIHVGENTAIVSGDVASVIYSLCYLEYLVPKPHAVNHDNNDPLAHKVMCAPSCVQYPRKLRMAMDIGTMV